jgi:hypothetical protein
MLFKGTIMKKFYILAAAMLAFTSTAFAQIGSLSSDLVYTPVTPCRIFDTRVSQGGTGPIVASGTKNFLIWGQTSYASQGGAASDCGITASNNTAAVAVNFTVVSPATAGFITAFPFGTTRPTAATVNFNAGDVRGNFSIAKNAQGGASDLSIFSTSNVEVVGDVVGYYSKPVATALECVTTTAVTNPINNGPLNGVFFSGAIPAACAAGYTQTSIICAVDNASASASPFNANQCAGNSNVNTHNLSASRVCCRIPGR